MIQWILAILLCVGCWIAGYFWQVWRRNRYQANCCINCLQPLNATQVRCVNCQTANAASHLIDWITGLIAWITGGLTLFGVLIWWPKFFWPFAVVLIVAIYLRYLNRQYFRSRRGIGSLLCRGIIGFSALTALIIVWLVWVL